MNRADLVAIGVAQIRQIEPASRAVSKSRWVFAGPTAVGNTCCVEGVALFRRLRGKSDGAAIAVTSGLTVDGSSNAERARWAAVEIPVFIGDSTSRSFTPNIT